MKKQEIFDLKSRDFWLIAIEQWVHNEVDRKMLVRRYLDGIYYEPLSEEFEMTANNCKKRVDKAKKQLFKHIKINEID
jgi:hypothetical protein